MSRYHVNHTTKIAQLADQAHEESNTVYNKRLETERADSVIFFDIFNQRFAELIVFECAKAVMDGTKEGDHYAMRIENHFDNGTGGVLHFGVEE